MSHVSYLKTDQVAEPIRPIFEDMEHKRGSVLNFLRVLAHNPAVLQGFLALNGALNKLKLDPRLRELAYVKASQVNQCEYCEHYHRGFGQKAGLTERQLAELVQFESSDAYTELERDVLRFAEGVTRHVHADEAVVSRLKRSLSDQELMELAMTVALANLTNRMNVALQIELP